MAILNNNPLIGSGGQQGYSINNSLRFRSSASAYLSRTPASNGNAQKFTYSGWIKIGTLGSSYANLFGGGNITGGGGDPLFLQSNVLAFYANGGLDSTLITTQVFRDPSAWYHVVVSVDTTQATASNRVKMYVNGNQITAFSTATYPSQNYNFLFLNKSSVGQLIGSGYTTFFDGYMADVNFIDGQALTPSSFGETDTTTGVWKPKAYTGTYGTNGFYLKFSDIATTSGSNAGLGKDFSGNSNYWTTNNISVTSGTTYDAMTDSPTLTSATVANYATWNPLERTAATYSEANLKVVSTSSAAPYNMTSTIQFPTTGKWYCEVEGIKGASNPAIGMGNNIPSDQFAMYRTSGVYLNGGISGIASSGTPATWTTGDIIGIAYDASAGTLSFYKNGSLQSGGFTSIPATGYFVAVRADSASGDGGFINCGQRPFSYTPPTGYVALNTYNLPTPTILQGNKYMDATLYTGTGSSLNVTGVNFQPDFVWIKERVGAADHGLYDAVRGVQKQLESNTTTAETTETTGLTAFNSNGFTVGALAQLNTNTDTYVGWSWKANGAGSSNTAGTITSTVSASTTAGFSIVTYAGTLTSSGVATVGHGLGVAPKMIISKSLGTSQWVVQHTSLTSPSYFLYLNTTDAEDNKAGNGTMSAPTSTVFSTNWTTGLNVSGSNLVAYCFAEIAGFSKIGSYTGNGSTDGPFVFTNFRPKYILVKSTGTASWFVIDTARLGYNSTNNYLLPNATTAETTYNGVDILSNGFKIRNTDSGYNDNGVSYIYASFAENPFKNALAR